MDTLRQRVSVCMETTRLSLSWKRMQSIRISEWQKINRDKGKNLEVLCQLQPHSLLKIIGGHFP